jgi:succinate dehydrogenase / fumarate reductase flavoprotein subunit
VKCFVFHDSPRRAHSIAAQGGINAAKNYQNDGDSVHRLFYDTIKGGDYRAREANVHRLAEVSVNIIDQCVAQGVPFAREYGGLLANRSFGGAQVSRTFYARGQTGQQLLLGAYSALSRMVGQGARATHTTPRCSISWSSTARPRASSSATSSPAKSRAADAVILATGGYGNVFNLSTYARGSNATAIWRAYKRGACFANPCYTQIHPTCIPVSGDYQSKLTLMSSRSATTAASGCRRRRRTAEGPRRHRRGGPRLLPRAHVPELRQPCPRDIASRAAKRVCDEGRGVGETGLGVYLDFSDAINRLGEAACASATATSSTSTTRSPNETPTRRRCASIRPCTTRWAASGWTTT